jgi:hypothetical protein
MSSAILYLAIVAIWACVLIPRWLRRDSARGASAPVAAGPPVIAEPGAEADDEDMPADASADEELAPAPVRAAEPPSPEQSRRRMLAARRRLLLMLLGLEIAAIALSVLGLAAVWVVVPPTIMLIGYLLLLREAAQADAERVQYEAEASAHPARVQVGQAGLATPAEGVSTEGVAAAAAALAAKFAAAPVAADYEDGPGRDFAPGLAGKYTTSNAAVEAEEEYYEAPRLRAVGD